MPVRLRAIFLAVLACGCVVYCLARASQPPRVAAPAIRAIAPVELGEQEAGQVATAAVVLANDGDADLVIGGVRASCSCTGLQTRGADGSYTPVGTLTVPPGGAVDAVVQVAVNGLAGSPLTADVYFQTNDPAAPEVAIPVRLSGIVNGMRAVPEAVAFGTVATGPPVVRVFDVVDRMPRPRTVARVTSSRPDVVSAELVPAAGSNSPAGGRLIGRVRLTVPASASGTVDERISVWTTSDGVSPTVVRVTGRVAPPVEIVPGTLTLPLRSDTGPVYTASLICVTHGNVTGLRVAECPDGCRVSFVGGAGGRGRLLVEVTPAPLSARRATVKLAASVDGVEALYPVDVIIQP